MPGATLPVFPALQVASCNRLRQAGMLVGAGSGNVGEAKFPVGGRISEPVPARIGDTRHAVQGGEKGPYPRVGGVGCPVAESFSAHDVEHVGVQVRARFPILVCSLGDSRGTRWRRGDREGLPVRLVGRAVLRRGRPAAAGHRAGAADAGGRRPCQKPALDGLVYEYRSAARRARNAGSASMNMFWRGTGLTCA
jgi:hypothetical protein